jgi:hypothetical protein
MGASPSGAQGSDYVQNGDFPHVASWVPPPRNQISKLEKTTVGAKITGLRGVPGAISGNHLVIRLMRPKSSPGHLSTMKRGRVAGMCFL